MTDEEMKNLESNIVYHLITFGKLLRKEYRRRAIYGSLSQLLEDADMTLREENRRTLAPYAKAYMKKHRENRRRTK